MWNDITVFVLVFIALFLGWLLSKFSVLDFLSKVKRRSWRRSYMQGIHLLLNEQSDKTIESFIQDWEVNSANFELHNALANMLRRKGEVDRAIRIHANLLATKTLTKEQVRIATTELACDYIKSGILDRAERLLINVVNHSKDFEERALNLLQDIYEKEKEWSKAILIAEQLLSVDKLTLGKHTLSSGEQIIRLSNYCCELAESSLYRQDYQQSHRYIDQAFQYQANFPRALMLEIKLSIAQQRFSQALKLLEQLIVEAPNDFIQMLPVISPVFENRKAEIDFLLSFLENHSSSLVERKVFSLYQLDDKYQALRFLTQQIQKRPTLKSLELLLHEQSGIEIDINLKIKILQQLVADILKDKPTHQCRQCGFSGQTQFWQCPQCHTWDAMTLIRGGAGD